MTSRKLLLHVIYLQLDAGQCAHFWWTIDSRDPIRNKKYAL